MSPDHIVTLRATLIFSYPGLTSSFPIYFITKLFEKLPLCIHFGGLCESKAVMFMKRKHFVLVISAHPLLPLVQLQKYALFKKKIVLTKLN